jgi:hypothetical protein
MYVDGFMTIEMRTKLSYVQNVYKQDKQDKQCKQICEWEAMKKLSRADEEARLQREAEENARVQQVLQVNTCQTGNDSTEKEGGISCIFGCQSSLRTAFLLRYFTRFPSMASSSL